jgi:hypothetical protein
VANGIIIRQLKLVADRCRLKPAKGAGEADRSMHNSRWQIVAIAIGFMQAEGGS